MGPPGEEDKKVGSISIGIAWQGESKHEQKPSQQEQKTSQQALENEPANNLPFHFQRALFWDSSNGEIPSELLDLAYKEIDTNNSGHIQKTELIEALQQCGVKASRSVYSDLFTSLDTDMSGQIDRQEFSTFLRDRNSKK